MVPIGLCDELTIEPADAFSFTCDDPALEGDDNLAARAARLPGGMAPAASLHLTKRVPTQAGLGGGSSDAAAVLHAAMSGALGAVPQIDWMAAARSLGSDVPFFLTGSAALVEGTGERVTAVGALPDWYVFVIKPPVAVSTADAYAQLDGHERESRPRSSSASLAAVDALQRGDFDATEALMMNDFHDVIVPAHAEIARAVDALLEAGARRAMLSGSGSAVFALAPNARTLMEMERRLDLPQSYARFAVPLAPTPEWRAARS